MNPGVIHTDMLEVVFGESASQNAKPDEWAESAAPFLLAMSAALDNGASVTVPGF